MKPLPDILPIATLDRAPDTTLAVPGSKSITNRALVLAVLADGVSTLRGALWADDTRLMVDALRALGFEIRVEPDPDEECNRTIIVTGRGGEIPAGEADLYVGMAGTTARFLTALVARGHGRYRIHGDPRMHERPMGDLLRALGIDADHLPVTIDGLAMAPQHFVVSGAESSQFASALLLAGHEVETAGGAPAYIEMTRQMLASFTPDYRIEPDLSSASYFSGAAYLTGGRIAIHNRPPTSLQVDGRFDEYLPPPATVSRENELGDSVMTLAVCALLAPQPVTITAAGRLRHQECDRIRALVTELRRVGGRAEETADSLTVYPAEPTALHGADIETYHDHRMAMTFGMLGLKVPGIRIKNPGCVAKSFPNFFDKLAILHQSIS